jgi:hypothetical protein
MIDAMMRRAILCRVIRIAITQAQVAQAQIGERETHAIPHDISISDAHWRCTKYFKAWLFFAL